MCMTDKVMLLQCHYSVYNWQSDKVLLQCQYSVYNWQHDVTPVSVFCVLPTKLCYSSVSIMCITDNMVLLQCHYSVYNWQSDVTPVSVLCV